MSVLPCARNGCQNVMCDRYSHNFGYICEECFSELKKAEGSIKKFMASKKEDSPFDHFWEARVDEEFKVRN